MISIPIAAAAEAKVDEEQRYTLTEAEAIILPQWRRDRCMKGPGAPGHQVKEFVQRNGMDEICIWGLHCPVCGAVFEATYP